MIIFEMELDKGDTRDIYWLGCTSVKGNGDEAEADNIYEQLMAEESHVEELNV